MQEETGPKCIVCQEGYTKKPTDILGMYVFTKKSKFCEVSPNSSGFVNSNGYITVTHSNYIHFICHENAKRADQSLKQPKKEWEGAVIRNDHTKCNSLFPLKGGNLPEDSYFNMVEKYFVLLQKTVGSCDQDKVKVVLLDFKVLMKRLAYEESFSRDSQGGGPEHNMHLVPFMIQMITYILKNNGHLYKNSSGDSSNKDENYIMLYKQEKQMLEFLEQAAKQQSDFLNKLEEEKKMEEEYEEEEKFSEDMSDSQYALNDNEDDTTEKGVGELSQVNVIKLDQVSYMLTMAIVFSQMPRWEYSLKKKFLSVILCTVSSMKDDRGTTQVIKPSGQQTDYATGKKVLTISKQSDADVQMTDQELAQTRRRRLSSDNKIDLVQRSLVRLRPLLIQLRLVDLFKQKWDGKKLGILALDMQLSHDKYLEKLSNELLSKANLQDVIAECDDVFREYKDKIVKLSSVEEFLQELGMLEEVVREFGSVEQFVMSHF